MASNPRIGVEDNLRRSYRAVFLGKGNEADGRRVLADLLGQTNVFSSFGSLSPEAGEAKREIGLYILVILGLVQSESESTLDSLETLTRLLSINKREAEKCTSEEKTDD